ncbi:hypothetical protein B0T25DRAFT_578485 [Lasiosphaeria hispida]|uniref:Fungal STAND N-terminal Goodbye domain-containing protein n=1 Tax=Lasiosphaeria hispida TaxID=260671 RepID=A0AAJ0MIV2_9PEZI|nr:hypothetical protein B0T25DRAFT_578485 [Lasiosphaeria hispida]
MRGQQLPETPVDGKMSWKVSPMEGIWAEAAREFESICGKSLQKGDVKGFDDVQRKIEESSMATYSTDAGQQEKWQKAKGVGLKSLQYLKMLVGAASQASSFIPVPGAVASITSNALCFVFDIPAAIQGYGDAVDEVFSEVSSALSQFQIYTSIDHVNPALIEKIHLVMVSFVKLCAHVVKYRQGGKWERFVQRTKSIFDDDSGLSSEMAEFRRVLQQQRDVEGTVTLAVVVETRQDLALLLEQAIALGKATEETNQMVLETQKGVLALKDDADRIKTLVKIRDALGVPPTVRLDTVTTQTCTNIYDRCLYGTGLWIWEHNAYMAWTAPNKGKSVSHMLIVSGPPSSGKTSVSALITKRLEEQKGRTYVAHYFFPASTKKADDENSVQSALKYMAFQIARADATVQKNLGKACDAGPGTFRRSANLESLDSLWTELRIGALGSGATYYLVFDGIENLPGKQVKVLLNFVSGSKLSGESAGRVRVLVAGLDDQFENKLGIPRIDDALRIRVAEHNGPDMRLVIDEALAKRGMLQHTKPDSDQQKARDRIVQKLPQNVNGSYSRLQFGLDDVIRLLSTRTAARELDRVLDQSISSHETAIKNLQRSLTVDEVSELNELLKWVLFSSEPMTLNELEAAMFLYSGTESLVSLQYIIENKYSAVLKLEDRYVYGKDGVKEYLQKEKATSEKPPHSKDRATISMTITINNVDQELCGHFLWDLAHKAIRDKFKFDFDAASPNSALHGRQAAITVDELEAHHTIVTRAFEYLDREPKEQTKEVGEYLVCWLPYHLGRLRQLQEDDDRELTPNEQSEIGQNLHKLFRDQQIFKRHRACFAKTWWLVDEMGDLQKLLMDSAIVRRVDREWRQAVQQAVSPTRGYLRELVEVVIRGLLRERSWDVDNAYNWILKFMEVDDKKFQQPPEPSEDSKPTAPSSLMNETDWDRVSGWCQKILALPDSELDSLWYERLAEIAASQGNRPGTILLLYQRALEKESPSWLCYRGMATAYFREGHGEEATAHMELALKRAERDDAMPKPQAKDIVELRLLLGQYAFAAGDVQKAADLYLVGTESEDPQQVSQAQLGYLKARLSFPDEEGTRRYLTSILPAEGTEGEMVEILKMVANDYDHDDLILKIFTVAKPDTSLMTGVVRALEAATALPVPKEDRAVAGTVEGNIFAAEAIRGVLLYDRGVAAYTYKVSADGTEPVGEALRLWGDSREQLSKVGGRNAFTARQDATAALAQHYFQSMMDGNHLDHVDKLAKLAEEDSNIFRSDSVGFLGAVYALRGEKEQARAALSGRVRQALQILSDDIPQNDALGFTVVSKALQQYQDLRKAAVAISLLGQPDYVKQALKFEHEDLVPKDGESKEQLLDMVTKLAQETIQVVESQVPDTTQQAQRIDAAKVYLESLVPTDQHNQAESGAPSSSDNNHEAEGQQTEITHAYEFLRSRISQIDISTVQWVWTCDGRTPDGKRCENELDFKREFYHCTFCSNRDFCSNCLARLRVPDSGAVIMACSAKHRWLRIPPHGDSMYLGLTSRTVRLPKEVQPATGDNCVLEIGWGENTEEVTVDAWKETLAKEWEIPLEEIKNETARQVTSEESESDGEKKD